MSSGSQNPTMTDISTSDATLNDPRKYINIKTSKLKSEIRGKTSILDYVTTECCQKIKCQENLRIPRTIISESTIKKCSPHIVTLYILRMKKVVICEKHKSTAVYRPKPINRRSRVKIHTQDNTTKYKTS